MTIMKAKDDADAIAIVNSTRYGLGSSVFSLDYDRAGRIGKQLRTGMCSLNDFGTPRATCAASVVPRAIHFSA